MITTSKEEQQIFLGTAHQDCIIFLLTFFFFAFDKREPIKAIRNPRFSKEASTKDEDGITKSN